MRSSNEVASPVLALMTFREGLDNFIERMEDINRSTLHEVRDRARQGLVDLVTKSKTSGLSGSTTSDAPERALPVIDMVGITTAHARSSLENAQWTAKYNFFKQKIRAIVHATARIESGKQMSNEYIPADELVNLVHDSMRRERMNHTGADHDSLSLLAQPPMGATEGFAEQYLANQSIRQSVASAVFNFLATIGRGLARGEQSTFVLTVNGVLTDTVLKGFAFRIPVGLNYMHDFSTYIYKDLMRCAAQHTLDSQYATLTIQGKDLILHRTRTIPKPQPSGWHKATVFYPE